MNSIQTITLIWIVLPLLAGFSSYLLPRVDRVLALGVALISSGYARGLLFAWPELSVQLIDSFGVTLQADRLSGFFVLTNALVTTAVVLYCWTKGKSAFFYTQIIILHGSVNAVFVCADFISLYVALEVVGIAAFLLIAYPRTDRSIWVGLRYLFVSNTAMLFYLIGAVLVYQANQSFAYEGLHRAPMEAMALIVLGMLTKGGVFVSGLWLPLTHAEAETPVSALLSGVVVKTGVFPLVRCALLVEEINPFLQLFSVATAFLGVVYAIFEKDTKRMLAASTVSQMGFVLAAPAAAGFYALTHGLAKAALFLSAGNLPSRKFERLRQEPLPIGVWGVGAIAALSISGLPLLSGYAAKTQALYQVAPWESNVLTLAAVGTVIAFAKFLFLPFERVPAVVGASSTGALNFLSLPLADSGNITTAKTPHLWPAAVLLSSSLVVANGFYPTGYVPLSIVKSLGVIGIGWLAYLVLFRRLKLTPIREVEQLEHLIGVMSLVLVTLLGIMLV